MSACLWKNLGFYPVECCEMPTPIRSHQRPLAPRDKYENFSRPALAKLDKLLRVEVMIRCILKAFCNPDQSQGGSDVCPTEAKYALVCQKLCHHTQHTTLHFGTWKHNSLMYEQRTLSYQVFFLVSCPRSTIFLDLPCLIKDNNDAGSWIYVACWCFDYGFNARGGIVEG